MKLAAVILAAGASSRYGSPKQLLEISGENLVQRACSLALDSDCSPVVAVLGAHREELVTTGLSSDVQIIENLNWQNGMGDSLSKGVQVLSSHDLDGVLILLADQPEISRQSIDRLKTKFSETEGAITLSKNLTSKGPPAIFSSEYFDELTLLDGDKGAKKVAEAHPEKVSLVDLEESIWDIDSPEVWREYMLQKTKI